MKKILFLIILVLIALGVYWKWEWVQDFFKGNRLTITLNTPATDLSPYALDQNNLTRTGNIYEGLVGLDQNLGIVPSLAVSWGNLDELTWEFRLREGVQFHDGTDFSAKNVLEAFEKGKNSENPLIKPYLASIKNIEISESGRLFIHTRTPDPLLLSKLSKFFIAKENQIGTGPYQLKTLENGQVELEAFVDYWGAKPHYTTVIYDVESSWTERENNFISGNTDILGAIPPEFLKILPQEQIKTSYGLEVIFLMFKLDDPIFKERSMREAVVKLIDPQKLVEIGNGTVRPATQFIAQGVFGYNPDIKGLNYLADQEPRDLFGIQLEKTTLSYPISFRTLAGYISNQLKKAGFLVTFEALEDPLLLDKIEQNSSPLYLVGWQAEDGDAGSFFEAFIHSQGIFNQVRYKNAEIDQLIEKARQEMDGKTRLALLREIGAKLEQDLIGIPLFETSRAYAVKKTVDWEPRLDGLILAAEAH